jgi:DNA-binding CsgD family transcriptional regulator
MGVYRLAEFVRSSVAYGSDASQFNTRLRRLHSLAACAELFRDTIAPFGFDTFACGELDLSDRDRTVFYIIDWPESWRRFYVGSGLVHRDPLIDALAFRTEPFTWSDLRADNRFLKLGSQAIERAAAEGWREGLIVPVPNKGSRVGLISLAGHKNITDPDVRAFLSIISFCLHGHARTLVAQDGFALPPVGLTAREIECLRLVARGLSDGPIAEALGVARSTAHEFIEKAKGRLKTRTRAEMVAVAVSLGIIDI